jgi:hypothetical protein
MWVYCSSLLIVLLVGFSNTHVTPIYTPLCLPSHLELRDRGVCLYFYLVQYILSHVDLLEDNIQDRWAVKRPQDGPNRANKSLPSKLSGFMVVVEWGNSHEVCWGRYRVAWLYSWVSSLSCLLNGYCHDVGSEMPITLLSADPLQLRVGDYVELH